MSFCSLGYWHSSKTATGTSLKVWPNHVVHTERTAPLFCSQAWIDVASPEFLWGFLSQSGSVSGKKRLLEHPSAFGSRGIFFFSLQPWPQQLKESVTLLRSSGFPSWKFGRENYLGTHNSKVEAVEITMSDSLISPNLYWDHYLDGVLISVPFKACVVRPSFVIL